MGAGQLVVGPLTDDFNFIFVLKNKTTIITCLYKSDENNDEKYFASNILPCKGETLCDT